MLTEYEQSRENAGLLWRWSRAEVRCEWTNLFGASLMQLAAIKRVEAFKAREEGSGFAVVQMQ